MIIILFFIVSAVVVFISYLLTVWVNSRKKTNRCPTLKCMNDSVPNQDCTSCLCKNKWQGSDCNICKSSCKNEGVMTPACDNCFCYGGWKGLDCSICPLVCDATQQINTDCTGCVNPVPPFDIPLF